MKLHVRLLILLFVLLSAAKPASAANCPSGGTTVFYGNGVLTDLPRAQGTLWTLIPAIDHALDQKAPNRDPSCVKYDLAYDSQFIKGGGLFTPLNAIMQLITAALQLALTNTASDAELSLYQDSETVPSLPDSWNAVGNQYVSLNSLVSVFQPDVQNHITRYQNELSNGNNVIVVAHSQGNLYVNQAYGVISIPSNREFSTVALASPADNAIGNPAPPVCGSGALPCHLTLVNDVITLVPSSLPPNAMNSNNPDRCASFPNVASMTRCHDVNKSYLLGNATGPSIIDAVVDRILSKLTIVESGGGSGTVVSTPAGIDCGLKCSAYFYTGVAVSLTATPDPASEFVTWSGDCTGTSETVTVNLADAKNCTATYKLKALTLTKSGTGTGTVTSVPPGINCGPGCSSQTAPFNGPVQLTAIHEPGSIFNGWGGDCASGGTNTTVQVTVNSSKSCIASFDLGGQVTITKSGTGDGTVTSVPAGINCGPGCTTQNAPFPANPPLQLTAVAANASSFVGWGGDCAAAGTNATAQLTVTTDKNCTAAFGSANPAVRLNPFGNQTLNGPYNIEVVTAQQTVTPAPGDITVTLLREVISQCSGLLFSSNRTVVVPQGQSSVSYNFNAGHDPACFTLPITTRYTVTQAVLGTSTILDLSGVPAQQLILTVTR